VRGVDLVVLDQGVDTSTAAGRMFFWLLGVIAEFEHALMSERTRDGLDAARARGRGGGQKPKLTPRQAKIAQAMSTSSATTDDALSPSSTSPTSSASQARPSTATYHRSSKPLYAALTVSSPQRTSARPARCHSHHDALNAFVAATKAKNAKNALTFSAQIRDRMRSGSSTMGELLAGVAARSTGILLGRDTYEMFEPAWSTWTVEDDPDTIRRLQDEVDGDIYVSGSAMTVRSRRRGKPVSRSAGSSGSSARA